jgi:hypothetical protein
MQRRRHYSTVSAPELNHAVYICFQKHSGRLSVKSIARTIAKQLDLDLGQLGPKYHGQDNTFKGQVAEQIEELVKEQKIFAAGTGEWIINNVHEEQPAKGAEPPLDLNTLSALGRAQKAVMDVMTALAQQNQWQISRTTLIDMAYEKLERIPKGTVNLAITSLADHGEQYLECPMEGVVAVSKKGQVAIRDQQFRFNKIPQITAGVLRKLLPPQQVEVAIAYVLAVQGATVRSFSLLEVSSNCAKIFSIEEQLVGTHAYDKTPFDIYCETTLRHLRTGGHVNFSPGTKNCFELTRHGWTTLQKRGPLLLSLGLEVPTEEPLALSHPPIVKEAQLPAVVKPKPVEPMSKRESAKVAVEVETVPVEVNGRMLDYAWNEFTRAAEPSESGKRPRSAGSSAPYPDELTTMQLVKRLLKPHDTFTRKRILTWVNASLRDEEP